MAQARGAVTLVLSPAGGSDEVAVVVSLVCLEAEKVKLHLTLLAMLAA